MSSPAPLNRRTLLTILAGSIATPLLAPDLAFAQEAWPARTVRYVNGFPARGRDRYALAHSVPEDERTVRTIVRCREQGRGGRRAGRGCGGEIAAGRIHGRPWRHRQNVLAIGSYAKLPYDPRGDFTFIGGMWQLPNILSARKDLLLVGSEGIAGRLQEGARANTPTHRPDLAPRCTSRAR